MTSIATQTKVCTKCGEVKPLSFFHNKTPDKRRKTNSTHRSQCRACEAEWRMQVKRRYRLARAKRDGRELNVNHLNRKENKPFKSLALLILLSQYREWLDKNPPHHPWEYEFLSEEERSLPSDEKYKIRYRRDEGFRQKVLLDGKENHKKNPATMRARAHKRRAILRKQHDGTVTRGVIRDLVEKMKACLYCGVVVDQVTARIDHMDPVSVGGLHSTSNLAVACHDCNMAKFNKPFDVWLGIIAEKFKRKAQRYYEKARGKKVGQSSLPLKFAI